jgi:hypothetical protein
LDWILNSVLLEAVFGEEDIRLIKFKEREYTLKSHGEGWYVRGNVLSDFAGDGERDHLERGGRRWGLMQESFNTLLERARDRRSWEDGLILDRKYDLTKFSCSMCGEVWISLDAKPRSPLSEPWSSESMSVALEDPPSYEESQKHERCSDEESELESKKVKTSDDQEHVRAVDNLRRVLSEVKSDDGDLYSTDGEYEEDQKFCVEWSKIPTPQVNAYLRDDTIEDLREKTSRVEFFLKNLLNIVILDVCRRGENSLDIYEFDCLSSRILSERNFQNSVADNAIGKMKME